jgi:hypothetical protein
MAMRNLARNQPRVLKILYFIDINNSKYIVLTKKLHMNVSSLNGNVWFYVLYPV